MPRSVRLYPWFLTGLAGLAVVAAVGVYWGASAELLNRALIVAASGALLLRSRAAWTAGGGRLPSSAAGAALLTAALIATPPAWFLAAQVGPRPILLWWLAAGWLAVAAGAVLVWGGSWALRVVSFPLLFLLFALPLPQRLEGPMQLALQECTTWASRAVLSTLGFAVTRQGFVLRLPGGDLGVVEACSGVRSVTALTAVAALIAHLRGMGLGRGGLFVLLSVPVIVLANVSRVAASGILQESVGVNAVRGTPHDILGYAAALLGMAALAGVSTLLRRDPRPVLAGPPSAGEVAPRLRALASALLAVMLLAQSGAALLGRRCVERQRHEAPLEKVATALEGWHVEDVPVADDVREKLACDRACCRVYRDDLGQEVQVWVIFWASAGSVRGYHHPDVCWPNRGWTVAASGIQRLELGSGAQLPVTVREFRNSGRRQMICFWSQEGQRVWTDADEEAAHAEGTPGHRWVRERLTGQPLRQSGRLAVLMGTDLWGSGAYAERTLLSFCQQFARDLYRVLPWAKPIAGVPADDIPK